MTHGTLDAVVVGGGPNGLSAAVELARNGASVLVLEAAETVGGGTRTAELTLPGFHHDVCSGAHPLGILSPYLASLPLAEHGLRWLSSPVSVAHPLDDGTAVLLRRSVEETAAGLGRDAAAYRRLIGPLVPHGRELLTEVLQPITHVPRHPVQLARFGLRAGLPASLLARAVFREQRARALFAGLAAHSILPLEQPITAAIAVLFLVSAHLEDWPVAEGGSGAITGALSAYLVSLGGRVQTGVSVRSIADLPPARAYLFDLDPRRLASIAGPVLPARFTRRLQRYRYGPAAFKLDWALDGPIPWRDPAVGEASTVHLGGTLDEIAASERAMWRGRPSQRPYVLMVQQSALDPSRAPAGKHTGYAYVHVPAGSTVDMTGAVERQVERFAPGFRDLILARHTLAPADLERYNPNFVGGAITGGISDLVQGLLARPVARIDPYATPNPRVYLCSASTPPGGGVHGMCGYHAARSVLRRLRDLPSRPLR